MLLLGLTGTDLLIDEYEVDLVYLKLNVLQSKKYETNNIIKCLLAIKYYVFF